MRPRAAATSKMERFVIIVNGFKPLTVITKRSILDVSAALHPPLVIAWHCNTSLFFGRRNIQGLTVINRVAKRCR